MSSPATRPPGERRHGKRAGQPDAGLATMHTVHLALSRGRPVLTADPDAARARAPAVRVELPAISTTDSGSTSVTVSRRAPPNAPIRPAGSSSGQGCAPTDGWISAAIARC